MTTGTTGKAFPVNAPKNVAEKLTRIFDIPGDNGRENTSLFSKTSEAASRPSSSMSGLLTTWKWYLKYMLARCASKNLIQSTLSFKIHQKNSIVAAPVPHQLQFINEKSQGQKSLILSDIREAANLIIKVDQANIISRKENRYQQHLNWQRSVPR